MFLEALVSSILSWEEEAGSVRGPERRYIRFFVVHAPPARLLAVRH